MTAGLPAADPVTVEPPAGAVRRAVMTQEWTRLTYLHWGYDPAVVQPLLPPGVRVDTVDGAAWVGLVPFVMRRVRLPGGPALPYLSSFLETNVRTYTVGPDGRRGVAFFTLEADRLLPVLVARASYRLPYTWARMSLQSQAGVLTYRSRRRCPAAAGASSRVRVQVGRRLDAEEVSPLDHWLTARWGLHSRWYGGRAVQATVTHETWPLHAARLLDVDASLVRAVGLPAPVGEPRVLYAPRVSVRIAAPSPLSVPASRR